MPKNFYIIILTICIFLLKINNSYSQNSISIARDFFNKFNNVENGWLAGDATISLLLPDGKTLWLFGDSFIGEKNGEFGINSTESKMINNAAILQYQDTLTAYYGGIQENPSSLIPADGSDIFWPEHAIIENDTIKILAVKIIYIDNGIPGFNFRTGTTYLAQFTYPGMEHISTDPVEYITDTTMRFGAHILKMDDYTYIFGVKDTTADDMTWAVPVLARVTNSISEPWEFYAGSGMWSYDCKDAKTIGDRPMSESFYVYEKDGKFYLIMHEIWTVGELYILEADNITGPWNRASTGGTEKLFAVVKPETNIFTYNLFAHPQFLNNDKLLISFNVNTSDFSSIYSDTRNYRARFFWLSVEDAITSILPDTINIFNDFVSITGTDIEKTITQTHLYYAEGKIYLESVTKPSVLNVYNIMGKRYLSMKVYSDLTLGISDLPKETLYIELVNKDGIISKKIINSHNFR